MMENNSEVSFSILIPAYKGRFLEMAISSVLCQSYDNWELVIVDDCSPENLKAIVERFEDSRIRYYRNERNFGAIDVVDNWNKCLDYAKGDYVICMGDDDMLCPNCLVEYLSLIEKYPGLDVFHGMTEIIDEDGKVIDLQEGRPEYETTYSLIYYRWLGRSQYIGDFLFRRSVLLELGGFYKLPLAWASDDISAIRASGKKGIANTLPAVFRYRSSAITISSSGSVELKLKAISLEMEWYRLNMKSLYSKPIDDLFALKLDEMFNRVFFKKRMRLISGDIKEHPMHFFMWLFKRKQPGLSLRIVVFGLLSAIYNKYRS